MVVAQSISTDPKALLRTEAPSVENLSTITSSEFALEREASFFSSVCEQLVESPSNSIADGDAFLDDEDEERGETDAFEGTPVRLRLRQGSITNTKHATSTEDA